jgi:uncharacterized protein involved in copper resistance
MEGMDHSQMDHSQMDQSGMDHSQMNHAGDDQVQGAKPAPQQGKPSIDHSM